MDVHLVCQKYGKERVRVLLVRRGADGVHTVHEIEASVQMEGDFSETYLTGDNSKVVATDTMKNTVQALAHAHLGDVLEEFPLAMAAHFLKRYPQIEKVTLEVSSRPWDRYHLSGEEAHPHMFTGRTMALPFSRVEANRDATRLQSGVKGVLLLKSAGSAFVGYPRCDLTTLPETDDRILATEMMAKWTFTKSTGLPFSRANEAIMEALLRTYATEFSPSLQNTLYLMGKAALAAAPEISDIFMAMPNKHYLPVNLKPFGMENNNEIFLPTDEPHGQIEGLISR
jgi:urate oxidase